MGACKIGYLKKSEIRITLVWHSQNLLAGEKGETKVWRWFKKQLGPIYEREICLESPGFYTTLQSDLWIEGSF